MQIDPFSQAFFSRSEVVIEKPPLYFLLKSKRQKETGNKATLSLGQQSSSIPPLNFWIRNMKIVTILEVSALQSALTHRSTKISVPLATTSPLDSYCSVIVILSSAVIILPSCSVLFGEAFTVQHVFSAQSVLRRLYKYDLASKHCQPALLTKLNSVHKLNLYRG